jgi:uncharacterized protein YbjT (DUF2867 family)
VKFAGRCPGKYQVMSAPGSERTVAASDHAPPPSQTDVVTGAFSNSGAAIAGELLAAGHGVRTLTGHPQRAPAGTAVDIRPLDFDDPAGLRQSLKGAHTLYNTYWVRFRHGGVNHQVAVARSRALFRAAASAGVQRIVHVSITHASPDSGYSYYRGKGQVEQEQASVGIPHAIARPALLFGGSGVLVNNIAWLLRRLPVFAIGGTGDYRLRGIHVADLARLCVRLGAEDGTVTVDAVGPESLAIRDLVQTIRTAIRSHARLVRVPGPLLPPMSGVLGLALRDRLLTREEYRAMADGLADSDAPATGELLLTEWIASHAAELGRHYANDTKGRF